MTRQRGCPDPVALERAFWTEDATTRLHIQVCASCDAEWQEIAALAEAGRAVPPASPSPRREEIRTALLASRDAPAPERRRWRAWQLAAPAAALAALAWWIWPRPEPEPSRAARGHLLAHDGARYMIAGQPPEEIVRLVDGTLTVEVDPLRPGERFRIVTGDAEVEVRGTAFDVSAAGDHLRAVRVIHGAVEVRPTGRSTSLLQAGQAWSNEQAAALAPAPVDARPDLEPTAPRDKVSAAAPTQPRRIHTGAGRTPAPTRTAAQQAFDEGWTAIRAGDFEAAAAAFERAATAGPGNAVTEDAHYWRAVALARAGRTARAIKAFAAFIEDHGGSSRTGEASVMLGWLLFDQADYAGAARRFRAAVADPSERIRDSAAKGLRAVDKQKQTGGR